MNMREQDSNGQSFHVSQASRSRIHNAIKKSGTGAGERAQRVKALCQAQRPDFDPRDPHRGNGEPALADV